MNSIFLSYYKIPFLKEVLAEKICEGIITMHDTKLCVFEMTYNIAELSLSLHNETETSPGELNFSGRGHDLPGESEFHKIHIRK